MTYTKPDITALGDAAALIQGGGSDLQESTSKSIPGSVFNADGELDD